MDFLWKIIPNSTSGIVVLPPGHIWSFGEYFCTLCNSRVKFNEFWLDLSFLQNLRDKKREKDIKKKKKKKKKKQTNKQTNKKQN